MTGNDPEFVKRLWAELNRRRVVKTAIAYVVLSWLLVEASSVLFPALLLPEWTVRLVVAMVILALPLVLVLAWMFDVDQGDKDQFQMKRTGRPPESGESPARNTEIASIAVSPFENLSHEERYRYIASGIAAELHNTFSRIHGLRVASRNSIVARDAAESGNGNNGRELNVGYIVSGSVQCADERMRVIVDLNNADEGTQIWSQSYQRDIDDLFAVQAEIARDVANQFGGARLREEIDQASRRPTEILDAWHRVQRARSYILAFTPESLERGVRELHAAIALDPEYAAAHAALASALAEKVLNGLSKSFDTDIRAVASNAERAHALAPTDPFVLKMCGSAWAYVGDYEKSLTVLQRAVNIAPFDFGTWGYFGWPLVESGKPEHLQQLHEIMQRILKDSPDHPGSPYWLYHRSVASSCDGNDQDAVEFGRQSVEKNPTYSWGLLQLANALGVVNRREEAADVVRQSLSCSPAMSLQHYQLMTQTMSVDDGVAERRVAGLKLTGLLAD